MVKANTLENDQPDTAAVENVSATVKVGNETCDKCGHIVKAVYVANKGATSLFFCAHHIRVFAEPLKAQGFNITPEDISYEAGTSDLSEYTL